MIDHISIAVRDLAGRGRFYEAVLATLGYDARARMAGATIGFGKKYPEFWLNERPAMTPVAPDSGAHICLRAPDTAAVDAFHAAALAAGGSSDGAPGLRPEYNAALLRRLHPRSRGNRIEAVTFLRRR